MSQQIGNPEELLVIGYGCKIFRDDEKANFIEEEKHLIPWMGQVIKALIKLLIASNYSFFTQ